jgi:hypothetical protein
MFPRPHSHTTSNPVIGIRRLLVALRGRWQKLLLQMKTAWVPRARAFRRRLVAAGIPLRSQFLELRCREGEDVSGLFSEFAAVLGALEHYEEWPGYYAGLNVQFRSGLYFESAAGPDWWEYYFEPISLGSRTNAATRVVGPHEHDMFAYRVEQTMPRQSGAALVARHIRLRPHLQATVDAYVRTKFGDAFVIGIHYRGTDKWEDAPRVPYEEIRAAVQRVAQSEGTAQYKLYLATDEKAFLDYMLDLYPDRVLYREMFRSTDGRPIDVVNEDSNHKKGEDAVIDCVLLSRTQHLIRTASNLSLCSTFFNSAVPEILLNPER